MWGWEYSRDALSGAGSTSWSSAGQLLISPRPSGAVPGSVCPCKLARTAILIRAPRESSSTMRAVPTPAFGTIGTSSPTTSRAEEEIRFDYSTSMEEQSFTMRCLCGAPECRHMIADFSSLPAEVRDRYLKLEIVMGFIARKAGARTGAGQQ